MRTLQTHPDAQVAETSARVMSENFDEIFTEGEIPQKDLGCFCNQNKVYPSPPRPPLYPHPYPPP